MSELRKFLTVWAITEQGIGESALPDDRLLIPVELARRASLASRRNGEPPPAWPTGLEALSKESVIDFVSRLAAYGKPIDAGDDRELAEAMFSLCRCAAFDPQGRLAELDRRFDRAMRDHVLDSREVLALRGTAASSVGPAFFQGQEPNVFISTRQACPRAIGITGNVGDNFGVPLYRRLSGKAPNAVGIWVDPQVPLLLTIGSVLARARDRALVWGTGAIQPLTHASEPIPTTSVFMGVRGPRTSEEVLRKHGIHARPIGDPGVLLPAVVDMPVGSAPDIDVGVVSHSVDKALFLEQAADLYQVTNYRTLAEFVESVKRCRRIISTGLHGMIFAHALGIPAVVVKVGNRITGQEFKFRDYMNWAGAYPERPRLDLTGYESLAQVDWRAVAAQAWLPDRRDARSLLDAFPFAIDDRWNPPP
jgi:hypothetical protein